MLKVEEGQACGILCAADEELPGSARRGPSSSPGARSAQARPAAASPRPAAPTATPFATTAPNHNNDTSVHDEYDEIDAYGDNDGDDDAAAGEQGSGSDGDTFSELSDPGGTEVVYVREGVAVWPGPRAARIPGRLSLVKQAGVLFLAWLPYSRGCLQQDGSFRVAPAAAAAAAAAAASGRAAGAGKAAATATGGRAQRAGSAPAAVATAARSGSEAAAAGGVRAAAGGGGGGGGGPASLARAGSGGGAASVAAAAASDRTQYAVHPIALSEVRCLRRHSPPLGLGWGCPSLTVVLASGVTLPPLHFTRGGIKTLITTLKQHIYLQRAAGDPSAYLVNDTADPLARSLSALALADVLIGGPPHGASATFQPGQGVVMPPLSPPPPPPAGGIRAAGGGDAWRANGVVAASSGSGVGLAAAAAAAPPAAAAAAAGANRAGSVQDSRGGPGTEGHFVGQGAGLRLGSGQAVSWSWADTPGSGAAGAAATATATATAAGGGSATGGGDSSSRRGGGTSGAGLAAGRSGSSSCPPVAEEEEGYAVASAPPEDAEDGANGHDRRRNGTSGNGNGNGNGDGDGGEEDDEDGYGPWGSGSGVSGTGASGQWAFGIVSAINRFVQNVRGTASSWMSALDEFDDVDSDLFGGSGSGFRTAYDSHGHEQGHPQDEPGGGAAAAAAGPGAFGAQGWRSQRNGGTSSSNGLGVIAAGCGGMLGNGAGSSSSNGGGIGGSGPAVAVARRSSSDMGRAGSAASASGGAWGAAIGLGELAALGLPPGPLDGHGPSTANGGGAAAGSSGRGGGATAGGGAGGGGEVATEVGDFELLDDGGCYGEAAAHPAGRRRVRAPPLSAEEWASMFDAEGRLVAEAAMRDRVAASGCEAGLRREVWKWLLGMYPRGSTAAQRAALAQKWQADYLGLRSQWQSRTPAQEARCAAWRGARSAVDKDVRRTDRRHPFFSREGCAGLRALRNVLLSHVTYDTDLGYCQGMSDLASPLLVVMRDEAEAFWALAALLERHGPNFAPDLAGMSGQLAALRQLVQLLDPPLHAALEARDCLSYYFAFRWLLIHFKREFKFDDVLSLWESCWACRRSRHLHLYLAAAVLIHHRRVILASDLDFDGMLRFCIGLEGKMELRPLLDVAEALVAYAGEAGREVTAGLP